MLAGNPLLQGLDLGGMELDDLAGLHVDHVVMVLFRHRLVTRATIAEIMLFDDAGIFEQFYRAVDGGNGNARIDLGRAAIQFLDIRMVIRILQDPGNDAALLGHSHAPLGAQLLQRFGKVCHIVPALHCSL